MAEPTPETEAKRAPVNGSPGGTISWPEHLRAWVAYARTYGTEQSAERIAERGGFGIGELVTQLGHMPTTWEPGRNTRFLRGVTWKATALEVNACGSTHAASCSVPDATGVCELSSPGQSGVPSQP